MIYTDHPQVAYPLNNLAELYVKQDKYEQAEPIFQRGLHIWEQQLGPDHHLAVASLIDEKQPLIVSEHDVGRLEVTEDDGWL